MTNNQTWQALTKKLQAFGFSDNKISKIIDGLDGLVKTEYILQLIEGLPADKQFELKSLISSQDELTQQKTIEQYLKLQFDEKQLATTLEVAVKKIISD